MSPGLPETALPISPGGAQGKLPSLHRTYARHLLSRVPSGSIGLRKTFNISTTPVACNTPALHRGPPCETQLSQFQSFQLHPVGVNVRKVVLRLLNKPAFGAAAENLGQPHGHLRRYAALFVHQLGKRGARDAKGGGGVRDAQAQ